MQLQENTMDNNQYNDIILEVIEVLVNSILYTRKIYPAGIFRKKRAYNVPIFISIFPPLNHYIEKSLKSARELKIHQNLHKIELVVYSDKDKCLESYVFEIENLIGVEEDPGLIEFEEKIRKILFSFDRCMKNMGKLPSNVTFKILMHTVQSAFVKLSHDSNNQHLQLLEEADYLGVEKLKKSIILPITALNKGFQLYAVKYT